MTIQIGDQVQLVGDGRTFEVVGFRDFGAVPADRVWELRFGDVTLLAAGADLRRLPGTAVEEQIRGLGDRIAEIAASFGLKSCSSCERRRAWLNRRFPRSGG